MVTVLPGVLLGHVLLIWLLIQNRWIVMSTTTVTVMPPIMASIVLSGERAPAGAADDRSSPWGKPRGRQGDTSADLKPSLELSLGAPRVQRSVPWLNTEMLPELRGNSADPLADQLERTEAGAKRPSTTTAKAAAKPRSNATRQPVAKAPTQQPRPKAKPMSPALQAGASTPAPRSGEDTLLRIPPPPSPAVALIPPPPAVNDLPWTPVPQQPVPPMAEARPSVPIPGIPDPVNAAPRDIPPLWSPQAAPPPPKLVTIAPPPPVLKTIPPPVVTAPPEPPAPAPVATAVPAATPAPAPTAAPTPVRAVPAPARVVAAPTPPPPPPPVAAVVTPPSPAPVPTPAPPEPVPAAPLALTPSPALPVPSAAPVVTAAPSAVMVPASTAPGAVAAPATTAAPSATPVRNPMVVEVPRYRLAEPGGTGNGTPQAVGSVATDGAEGRGRAVGPTGAGSAQGSALGLGAGSAAPLPVAAASASGAVPANKALNLNLPRVEVYRSGIGPVRQPSFADQANAQLRRGAPKDPMAEAINSAETPDCLKDSGMGVLGAPVAAYKAMTGKCK